MKRFGVFGTPTLNLAFGSLDRLRAKHGRFVLVHGGHDDARLWVADAAFESEEHTANAEHIRDILILASGLDGAIGFPGMLESTVALCRGAGVPLWQPT